MILPQRAARLNDGGDHLIAEPFERLGQADGQVAIIWSVEPISTYQIVIDVGWVCHLEVVGGPARDGRLGMGISTVGRLQLSRISSVRGG